MKTVTIFAPTYNRALMIQNLFESLKKQSCFDFEWFVIDDGSIDNTEELFREWVVAEMPFQIRLYKFENGGKCRAINKALELAHDNLFLTIDSDDYLIENTIEKVLQWEHHLPCGGLTVVSQEISESKFLIPLMLYFMGSIMKEQLYLIDIKMSMDNVLLRSIQKYTENISSQNLMVKSL